MKSALARLICSFGKILSLSHSASATEPDRVASTRVGSGRALKRSDPTQQWKLWRQKWRCASAAVAAALVAESRNESFMRSNRELESSAPEHEFCLSKFQTTPGARLTAAGFFLYHQRQPATSSARDEAWRSEGGKAKRAKARQGKKPTYRSSGHLEGTLH